VINPLPHCKLKTWIIPRILNNFCAKGMSLRPITTNWHQRAGNGHKQTSVALLGSCQVGKSGMGRVRRWVFSVEHRHYSFSSGFCC
jgi:hypothetical protein